MATTKTAATPDVINAPLKATFRGKSYLIPPASARAGMRLKATMQAAANADDGVEIDGDKLAKRMGVDPTEYDMAADILGADTYDKLLDALTEDEMTVVVRAQTLRVLRGREDAEEYLADPTRLAGNRQQRRAAAKAPARKAATRTTQK